MLGTTLVADQYRYYVRSPLWDVCSSACVCSYAMPQAVDLQDYLLAYNLPMLAHFMHRASTHGIAQQQPTNLNTCMSVVGEFCRVGSALLCSFSCLPVLLHSA